MLGAGVQPSGVRRSYPCGHQKAVVACLSLSGGSGTQYLPGTPELACSPHSCAPLSASRQASSALSEALCHMSPPVCLATVTSQHPFTCWSLNPRESEESPNKPSQVPTRGNKESEGKRPGQGHVGSRRQSWDLNLGLSEPVPHARASIPSVHGA